MSVTQTIELVEWQPAVLPPAALPEALAYQLWLHHRDKLEVRSPGFQTGGRWQLIAKGWVGHLPLDEQQRLLIRPKVPLANLFRMLEYAYLQDFVAEGDSISAESMDDYYQRLALILAERVLHRIRRGIYREYAAKTDRLPFVRGQLRLTEMLQRPWVVDPDCRYDEHTADIEDNQLLAWTMHCIVRSGLCEHEVGRTVRQTCLALVGRVGLVPLSAHHCVGRQYNRLNDDYRMMHGLCRFFLEHSGPGIEPGSRMMVPFLVNMGRLFESFVAEWLRRNLPEEWALQAQETVEIGAEGQLCFQIDLVLLDRRFRRPLCVLDTKYKDSALPSTQDVSQVIAYAEAIGCRKAVLVYPEPQPRAFHATIGQIGVHTISFDIGVDPETGGMQFLEELAMICQ